jgi:hypothetical protein
MEDRPEMDVSAAGTGVQPPIESRNALGPTPL